jgi:hypothetical protein
MDSVPDFSSQVSIADRADGESDTSLAVVTRTLAKRSALIGTAAWSANAFCSPETCRASLVFPNFTMASTWTLLARAFRNAAVECWVLFWGNNAFLRLG